VTFKLGCHERIVWVRIAEVTRSTSPAISSDGTRGCGEEAVILMEVYAVEAHLCAVIRSGPAGQRLIWPVHLMHSLWLGFPRRRSGLETVPTNVAGDQPAARPLLAGNHGDPADNDSSVAFSRAPAFLRLLLVSSVS
jgi:hypothetical protein